MGCMAVKLPSCLDNNSSRSELIEPTTRLQDCYRELTTQFKIRESLTPSIIHDRVSIRPFPSSPSVLLDKDFPVFQHSNDFLLSSASEILSQFRLDTVKLASFLDLISKNYSSHLPYHNFKHGFSVFQLVYAISERNEKLFDFVSNQDYLYLLLAALGHDVCHPGINNGYLISTKHPIALKYNNLSVLENHHASVTLELLRSSALLQEADDNYLREVIVFSILSTDMAKHKDVIASFEKLKGSYDKSQKSHRMTFLGFFLHCADLGNPTLKFSLAATWSFKILQEFNNQVSYEERARVTVSEFMRIGNDLEKIKKSQVGLIDFVVLPMWICLAGFVNNVEELLEAIKKNRMIWEESADKMGCCQSEFVHKESFLKIVRCGIEKNNARIVREVVKKGKKQGGEEFLQVLQQPIVEIQDFRFSALSYSVVLGKNFVFSALVQIGCRLDLCEEELCAQGTSVLYELCSKGYSEILKDYLPVFLKKTESDRAKIQRKSEKALEQHFYSPVQIAAYMGHLPILSLIHEFTKDFQTVPKELDFSNTDPNLQENSALIACRSGNFHILKFIYSKSPQLLFCKNKLNENAIHITCCGSIECPKRPHLKILNFLVTTVGLDIRENYLKTLLTVEDPDIKSWVESELETFHIVPQLLDLTPKVSQQTSEVIQNVSKLSDS